MARFPVEQVMTTRMAEEKIGAMRTYRYPLSVKTSEPDKWLARWIIRKQVLIGWEPVRDGLVKSFKGGRAKHIISGVRHVSSESEGRPVVEVLCHLESFPVFNWTADKKARRTPVILLAPEQVGYFKLCKNCEAKIRKMLRGE